MAPRTAEDVPDLLSLVPTLRIDFERTRLAVNLAFAGGTSGGLFSEALEHAVLPPSTWEPNGFSRDLFLQRFVAQAFKVGRRGEAALSNSHLVRVLANPPRDPAVVLYRREVVHELCTTPDLRRALERLYTALNRFRAHLESTGGERNWDPNRRQLEILAIVKEIIDSMSSEFAGARSGLSRLGAFGLRIQNSEAYRALADLLRYDARLATVDLRLGIGADGRIRGFELLAVGEDRNNPFVSPPWKRWFAKLELFLRGYRFGDGEVMARLIDAVFTGVEPEIVLLVQLLGDLEFYLGALGFADTASAAGLAVCLPNLVEADAPRALLGLFNPLLLVSGIVPVPCDLRSERLTTTVLVTGPNSGGKTRLLQAIGFTQLLAQAGLFVPAREASLALTSGLVVSLIQEVRADQTEGRLGTELIRIRELFERLPPGAMVLLDELCSGTNPSEGEEIFELVLAMLTRLRPQAFITTHFLGFAARLSREGKLGSLGFLQVELDPERRPTYQFVPGVAQTSLAGHAAARLGVTGEQLLALIERNVQHWRGARSTEPD